MQHCEFSRRIQSCLQPSSRTANNGLSGLEVTCIQAYSYKAIQLYCYKNIDTLCISCLHITDAPRPEPLQHVRPGGRIIGYYHRQVPLVPLWPRWLWTQGCGEQLSRWEQANPSHPREWGQQGDAGPEIKMHYNNISVYSTSVKCTKVQCYNTWTFHKTTHCKQIISTTAPHPTRAKQNRAPSPELEKARPIKCTCRV